MAGVDAIAEVFFHLVKGNAVGFMNGLKDFASILHEITPFTVFLDDESGRQGQCSKNFYLPRLHNLDLLEEAFICQPVDCLSVSFFVSHARI